MKQTKSNFRLSRARDSSKRLIYWRCYKMTNKEKIEKDLELLDILKKHYDKDSLILSLGNFMSFHIHNDDIDFNKVKEWLENE